MTDDAAIALPTGRAKADLDRLYGEALTFAVKQITRFHAFYPFALALRATDDTVVRIPIEIDDEKPRADAVVHVLVTALTEYAAAGEVTALVVVTDISMKHPSGGPDEGVRLVFEHRDAPGWTMVVPYAAKGAGEPPELAEAFAVRHEPTVFGRTA